MKQGMRGQVSIEVLMLIALILVIVLPTLFSIYIKAGESQQNIAVSQANIAATRLGYLIDTIGYSADTSMMITEVKLSSNVDNIELNPHEIVFKMRTSTGYNDIVKYTRAEIDLSSDLSKMKVTGTYNIKVENVGGKVRLSLP